VDECKALVETARSAQMRLPVCAACANWTLELDTFWCLYLSAPAADDGAPVAEGAAAVGHRPFGSLSLVNLAACGRRTHCEMCSQPPSAGVGGFGGTQSLSLVVGQLSDGKSRYVSYRDSPTTELLQDALGGRAKTAWLTHLIPGRDSMDYEHNRGSLAMAQRVRQIRNRPQRVAGAPLGLAETAAEGVGAEAVAEERELAELQRLLTSGPSSKRPLAASSGVLSGRGVVDLS